MLGFPLAPLPRAAATARRKSQQRSLKGNSRKSSASQATNVRRKILMAGCGLLFVASLSALIIVAMSGNAQPQYNQSMKQFAGQITVEQMDDEYTEWADEYMDLTSTAAKSLISDVSLSVLSGLDMEGVITDDFRVLGLNPSEPKSFSIATKSSDADAIDTVEYEDVRFVTMNFETYGTPSRNVPTFMASNGRWEEVARVIQARLAAKGIKAVFNKIELQDDFMANVKQAARSNLSLLQVSPAAAPLLDACDCKIDGTRIDGESMTCHCGSPCFPPGDKIITGGVRQEFTLDSPICLSAFYAGIIEGAGGNIEAIPIGQGQSVAGEPQYGVAPSELAYQTNLYKIKKYGPIIKPASDPISPLRALELQYAQGKNDEMLVIHVLYTKIGKQQLTYSASLASLSSYAAKSLERKVAPKIVSAIKGSGFSIGEIEVTRIIQAPEKKGVIIGFRVYSDDEKNPRVAVSLETKSPGSFAVKLASSIATDGGTLRSVRYAAGFLEKMKSSASG